MKKQIIGGVTVGVLLVALAVGGALAQQGAQSQEPVQTQTQTQTVEITGECPGSQVQTRAAVQRELGRGGQGRMHRLQQMLFGK